MILEALRSVQTDDDVPSYYKPQVVSWVIHLTDEGDFVSLSDVRDKKNPLKLALPTNGRASDVSPHVAADNASYVLPFGCYVSSKKAEKMAQRHEAFKSVTQECAKGFEPLRAVLRFLENDVVSCVGSFKDAITESDNIVFMIDGEYMADQKEIANYWLQRCAESTAREHSLQSDVVQLRCIVCGTPLERVIDAYVFQGVTVKDKVSMIPWNKGTEYTYSYGMERGENSAICASCSDTITRNYNSLHNHHSIKVGSIEYLILSRSADADMVQTNFDLLAKPREEDVHALYRVNQARYENQADMDYDEHYWLMFTNAPSPGRGYFFGREYTLNQTRDRVGAWLKSQEIIGNQEEPEYFSVGQVLSHLYAPKKGKHSQDSIPIRLLDNAFSAILDGLSLPRQLLMLAIQRNRAEMRVTKQRAILLNLMLEQIEGVNLMGSEQSETSKGYLLGRVLSLLSQAQQEAIGKVNAPLSARFWSGFSTAPAVTFPRLMSMYNQYYNKLQKTRPGSAIRVNQQLTEILSMIGETCPNRLSNQEQAAFSLGFYFQEQLRYQKKASSGEEVAEPAASSQQIVLGLEKETDPQTRLDVKKP